MSKGWRGWLQTLKDNKKARNAFKQNKWNSLKIVADHDHFITYINGVQAVNITDTLAKNGFIAFQLHKIYDKKQAGKKVMFKNIRIKEIK